MSPNPTEKELREAMQNDRLFQDKVSEGLWQTGADNSGNIWRNKNKVEQVEEQQEPASVQQDLDGAGM